MQIFKEFKITELIDKSKKIIIRCFYDNSIWWQGNYEDIPNCFLNIKFKMFSSLKDTYEFTI